jgi:hypothetical protein
MHKMAGTAMVPSLAYALGFIHCIMSISTVVYFFQTFQTHGDTIFYACLANCVYTVVALMLSYIFGSYGDSMIQ